MAVLPTVLAWLSALFLAGLAIASLRFFERPASLTVALLLLGTAVAVVVDDILLTPLISRYAVWLRGSLLIEGALVPIWLLCSLTCARSPGQWGRSGLFVRGVTIFSCFLVLPPALLAPQQLFYNPDFPHEPLLFLTTAGFYYYVVIMICLVVAFVQFESTFINASPQALWNIKFFLIALCLMLAVQVFYYSQALLYRTINIGYASFRSFMFIIAGGLMVFAFTRRDVNIKITISRQAALKSAVLFAVGIYLLILGAFGEGLKYCSGLFSRSIGISVVFLTGTGIALLCFSGRVRRELKVVLMKHFYQNKYDYRTQWLLFTEQLSTTSWNDMLQSVLEMYCNTFGVSGAALFLYDDQRRVYTVAATCRMDLKAEVVTPQNSLVVLMHERGWVYFVRDHVKAVLEENGPFLSRHKVSFVVPLPGEPAMEGFIVLGEMIKPDENYIYEDFDLMKTYARQAYQTIRHHRLSQALLVSREEAAVGNVATFIMHDLKNQLAAISLITENAPQLIGNPDYQKDLLISLQSTVQKIHGIISNLKTLDKNKTLHFEKGNLLSLVGDSADQLGSGHIKVLGEAVYPIFDRSEMQKVTMNLLVNAVEASASDATVTVEVGSEADQAFFRVRDSGCGMTSQFIQNELFVPFHSTKQSGLGIGLFQSRQIVQAHGGRIDVESAVGVGTTFTVWLPASEVLHEFSPR